MVILAWILGSLAGLCGIMGIIVGIEVIPDLAANLPGPLDAMFWLTLGILLMLGCIVCVNSRTEYE